MLLSSVARTRLRVTTTTILQTHAKNAYSTKASTSGSGPTSSLMKYIAIAGLVSTSGLWWLITTRDDAPQLESPPAERWTVEPGPSRDQVTQIISQGAYSFPVRDVAGVSRYDGAQLASNSPCEDRFTHGKLPSPWNGGKQWMAWAVFDGHIGCQTAELLTKQLLPFVRHSLNQVKPPSNEESLPEELVQCAIKKGFVSLDDSIIKTALDTSQSEASLQDKVKKLAPAFAGSCALLSMYDSTTKTLHVACTGDSRAVLGQRRADGKQRHCQ